LELYNALLAPHEKNFRATVLVISMMCTKYLQIIFGNNFSSKLSMFASPHFSQEPS
jgi:hypothetical protein